MTGHRNSWKAGVLLIFSVLALATFRCSSAQAPAKSEPAVKRIPADQAFAGFLKDYASLKPNARVEGDALTFAATDAKQNLRSYLAIIVDPVEVYIATDADVSKVSEISRIALTTYFHRTNLGARAEVGARNFSRVEKFAAAREALDEWASRVRTFLDSEHELRGEGAERADKSYRPYYGFEETKL